MNVFVTGASRGVGRAVALEFAKNGYNVAACALHSEEALKTLAEEVKSREVQFYGRLCDVQKEDDIKEFVSDAEKELGPVDVVVNNAGIADFAMLKDTSAERWNEILNTSLGGCFNTCKAVYDSMVSRKTGSIINISSVWGIVGASCEVAYSAAKAGVNGLTLSLAKELAPSNISVNALALGFIDTDMNKGFNEEVVASIAIDIPAGRIGSPEEVGRAVLKIVEAGPYLTGQIIKFDGGWK